MSRKKHGADDEWRAVLGNFFTVTGNVEPQKAYWNPYQMFGSNEEVRRFFNGYEMPEGKDKLDYREKFAKWAIAEALKDFPAPVLDPAGEAITTKTVTYPLGNAKKDHENEDQQDAEQVEVVQGLYGAAQALFYASPNCLGPPIHPAALYLQMKKVGKHGQSGLSLYNSPLFPEVEYRIEIDEEPQPEHTIARHIANIQLRPAPPNPQSARPKPSKGFLDTQVTGIAWILSRLLGDLPQLQAGPESARERDNRESLRGPKYGGAILADSMGLGKTLTTIASIELLASHRLNVQYDERTNQPVYRPILILCPNVSVTVQWVEELLQNTSPNSILKILVAGGDAGLFAVDDRVSHLPVPAFTHWPDNHSHVWNENDPNAAKTVILCPLDTWAHRTVYTTKSEEGKTSWHSRLAENGRDFSLVCVDEAHRVKNKRTRLYKSVLFLERQFTLLITATPCTNALGDLHGLVELLWSSASKQIDSVAEVKAAYDGIEAIEDFEEIIQDVPSYHDLQLIAGCPSLLQRFLKSYHNGRGQDIGATRRSLHFFESLAMLKRGPGSFIFEDFEQTKRIPLEGLYPGVNSRTVNIDFDAATAVAYQSVHLDLLVQYLRTVKYWPAEEEEEEESSEEDAAPDDQAEKHSNVTQLYRKWQIAASSMDVYKLELLFSQNDFGPDKKPVTAMRQANRSFIDLAEFLLEGDDPTPTTALGYLKLAIKSSPVLRYILHDLKEHVFSQRVGTKIKKVLITENVPMLAYYYEVVLQFIGINCRTLHADLGEGERKRLIADFNSDSWESTQVLIQMYTVGFAGTNLHKNCSRVIVGAQAHSLAVQWQAIHRVIRVGQTENVDVIRVKIPNSFHAFLESQQTEKILPELSARVQGSASHILVQLLNDFQSEVVEAWDIDDDSHRPMSASPGISSGHGPTTVHPEDETSSQKERSKHLFESIEKDDEISSGLDLEEKENPSEDRTIKKRKLNFRDMKTRVEYYQEFRKLPETRSHFDHQKYRTHHLLQFEKVGGVWTIEDLENPAVLERGLELILRAMSGASHVDLVPVPQINLFRVPRDVLYWLMDVAADFAGAEQGLARAEKRIEEVEEEGDEDDHEHGGDIAHEGPDDDDDMIILDGPPSGISRSHPGIIGADRPAASTAKDEDSKTVKSEEIGKGTQHKVEEAEDVRVKPESSPEGPSDDSYLRTWLDQLPDQDGIDQHSIKKDSAPTGAVRLKKEPDGYDTKSQQGSDMEDGNKEPAAKHAGSQLEPIVIDDESQAGDNNDGDDGDDDVQFVSENRISGHDGVRFPEEDWRAVLRRRGGL
ncbi:hypothetical protein KJ359_012982 [Pestalotiopsis sp. 9143b]|nr:hypothetical protein KJ359_012982 [Pestalotiopsis sp. 9143b]